MEKKKRILGLILVILLLVYYYIIENLIKNRVSSLINQRLLIFGNVLLLSLVVYFIRKWMKK